MVNNFNIAQNIRTLREERGYTIEKLAERAGVSANHKFKYGILLECIGGIERIPCIDRIFRYR